MTLCKIEELSVYHPPKVINNELVASKLNLKNEFIKGATLERLFGIKERRYADKDVQVSDLATKAALPIVEKIGRENIDFLIFASACQDLIEPATCNIIKASDDESGIHFQKFLTRGSHWELCTIKGGGSMFPQDVTKNYFEGKTAELKDVLLTEAKTFTLDCIEKGGWKIEDIDHLVTHQVSLQSFEVICQSLGIPLSKNISVFEEYGNTAGSAIPLSLHFSKKWADDYRR